MSNDERSTRRKRRPRNPRLPVVLFVDYENASRAAREALRRGDGPTKRQAHFNPVALGQLICKAYNSDKRFGARPRLRLAEVRVYRGEPDPNRDLLAHEERVAQARAWQQSVDASADSAGQTVLTIVRPRLQYGQDYFPSAREREGGRPVEKEVDTGIALDLIAETRRNSQMIAILFSNDRDLLPAVYDVFGRSERSTAPRVHFARWAEKHVRGLGYWATRDGHSEELWEQCRLRPEDYREVRDPGGWVLSDEDRIMLQQWHETDTVVEGRVVDSDWGGLILEVRGVRCKLSIHQLASCVGGQDRAKQLRGQHPIPVKVFKEPEEGRHPVVSELRAGEDSVLRDIEPGRILVGRVALRLHCAIVVRFDGFVGVVRRRDLACGRDADPLEEYAGGQKLPIRVVKDPISGQTILRTEDAASARDQLLRQMNEGSTRTGLITSTHEWGAVVDLGNGLEGFLRKREISWERDVDPRVEYRRGQEVTVKLAKIRTGEWQDVELSVRRLASEQWDEVVAKFEVRQIVPSVVTKPVEFGAFARLEGLDEGLVYESELADRRINHPREVVTEGDVIPVKIVRIERDRHRLDLSLRQARTDAERAGWMFDQEGRIARLPDDVAEQFGVEPDQPRLRSG